MIKSFYKTFAVSHIETADFITFAEEYTGQVLEPIIRHYLYKADLPVLAISVKQRGNKKILSYVWEEVEDDFALSVWIKLGDDLHRLRPTTVLQEVVFESSKLERLELDLAKSLILEGTIE